MPARGDDLSVFMCNNILFIYKHYYYCITDVPSDSSNGLIRFSLVSQSIIIMVTVVVQLYSPRLWYHKLVSYAIPDVFSKCQDNRAHNHVLNLLYRSKCDQNLQSVCLLHVILCTICTYHPRFDSSTCGADCIFSPPPPPPPPPPLFFIFSFLPFFLFFLFLLSFFLFFHCTVHVALCTMCLFPSPPPPLFFFPSLFSFCLLLFESYVILQKKNPTL